MTNYNNLSREELITKLDERDAEIVILENLIRNISCPICENGLPPTNDSYRDCFKCSRTTCGDCGSTTGSFWICDDCFSCKNCKQKLTLHLNCDSINRDNLCYTCSSNL